MAREIDATILCDSDAFEMEIRACLFVAGVRLGVLWLALVLSDVVIVRLFDGVFVVWFWE